VIEGEGLGGFARRFTVNDSAEGLFRPRRWFFAVATKPTKDEQTFSSEVAITHNGHCATQHHKAQGCANRLRDLCSPQPCAD
jgi:hypothetical protein